jgi:predicted house-cleaning NTP pyrophosphatase (Maf/HAM1 superfamily)
LASKSAGRKKLLESLNAFNFNIFPSDFEEDLDKKLFNTAIEYNRATCQVIKLNSISYLRVRLMIFFLA